MCLLQNGAVSIQFLTVVIYYIPPFNFSLIPPVLTDTMLYITSILKDQIGKGLYLQWESKRNLRIQGSEYNLLCHWNLNAIKNAIHVYFLILRQYLNFSKTFFYWYYNRRSCSIFAHPVCVKISPLLDLSFLIDVGRFTWKVSFFLLPPAFSSTSPISSPFTTKFGYCWASSLEYG